MIEFNLGIVDDPRPQEQKAKDFKHSEVAGDIILEWKEKLPSEWKKYKQREQDGSLSCVAQATAKAVEILNSQVMSAHPIYRARENFPGGGMWTKNCGEIWRKQGSTLESIDPSQNQNETQMNRDVVPFFPIKMGGYAFPKVDIEEIAEAVELHKQCTLLIRANKNEWTAIPKYNGKVADFGHEVCAVDYFLYEEKKAILIEDSAYPHTSISQTGQRILKEEFLLKRCENAMYLIPLSNFIFTKTLRYGMKDPEVKELQRILSVIITGYFGNLTLAAIKKFQSSHGLTPDGIVGPKTRFVLNNM